MTYNPEDLRKAKRIISEAMAIIQTLADALNKKRLDPGLSGPEDEMLSDLNTCYDSGEGTIRDIDAVENDLPPWDEEPA